VLKFIPKLVATSETFLAKGDIFLGSDIALIAIFRNRTSNFPFKTYGRTLSEHGLWYHIIFVQSEDGQLCCICNKIFVLVLIPLADYSLQFCSFICQVVSTR